MDTIEYRFSAKIRSRIYHLKYQLNAAIGEVGRRLVRFSQRDSNRGRTVRTIFPPQQFKDFNDMLTGKERKDFNDMLTGKERSDGHD